MNRLARCLIILAGIVIADCGGSEYGYLVVSLENARGTVEPAALSAEAGKFGLSTDALEIARFQVTVTGEGTPLTAAGDATATELRVDGVPYKVPLTVLIEAFNAEGTVIRRRRIEGLVIKPGVVAPMESTLNTVPVVLNLRSGSIVLADRLRLVGFGEPGSSIRVESRQASSSISMNESVGGSPMVVSPSLSTGLFEFVPPSRLSGRQTLTVIDEETGESSSLTVYVVDGSDRPGRRLVTAGGLGPAATVGSSVGGTPAGNFPAVLETLAPASSEEERP